MESVVYSRERKRAGALFPYAGAVLVDPLLLQRRLLARFLIAEFRSLAGTWE